MSELTPRQRFAKYFPDRVEKIAKTLELVENCSNKHNYEWDEDLIHDCFVALASHFKTAAQCFDVDFTITVDGTEAHLLPPKKER
jgi:hypothetical protein